MTCHKIGEDEYWALSIAYHSQHYCAESLTNVRRSWWRSWWSHCGCWGWQEDKKLVTCGSGGSVMGWGSHDRVSHNFIFTLCHSYTGPDSSFTQDKWAHCLPTGMNMLLVMQDYINKLRMNCVVTKSYWSRPQLVTGSEGRNYDVCWTRF